MRRIFPALVFALTLFTSPVCARDGESKLYASLDGNSATTPNAAYGTGIFSARVDAASGQFCYKLTSQNVALLTKAVIGEGKLGAAGPTVVTLLGDSPKETCIVIDTALAARLADEPSHYYIEIHTRTHPNGEIRGQLMR